MLNDEESPVLDTDGRVVKASDHSGVFVAYSLLQQSDGAATQGFETRTAPSAFRAKVDKITKNRALFNSKDGDHDGKLTSKELSKILKPKRLQAFFSTYDADGDHQASWEEVMKYLKFS